MPYYLESFLFCLVLYFIAFGVRALFGCLDKMSAETSLTLGWTFLIPCIGATVAQVLIPLYLAFDLASHYLF